MGIRSKAKIFTDSSILTDLLIYARFGRIFMKTLILMRHAKAEKHDVSLNDFNRHLLSKGVCDAKEAGQILFKQKGIIDKLVTSPAMRALETALIIRKKLGKKIKSWSIGQGVYASDAEELSKRIALTPRKINSLMLIGHNPGLDELVSLLSKHAFHLRTAAVVQFDFEVDEWAEIFKSKPIRIICLKG